MSGNVSEWVWDSWKREYEKVKQPTHFMFFTASPFVSTEVETGTAMRGIHVFLIAVGRSSPTGMATRAFVCCELSCRMVSSWTVTLVGVAQVWCDGYWLLKKGVQYDVCRIA